MKKLFKATIMAAAMVILLSVCKQTYAQELTLQECVELEMEEGDSESIFDDTTPKISNMKVSDITPIEYRVTANVTDNTGVKNVFLEVWDSTGQKKVIEGMKNGSLYTFAVKTNYGGVWNNYLIASDHYENIELDSLQVDVPKVDTILMGDVNYDVQITVEDAMIVLKQSVGLEEFNDLQLQAANMDGNNSIDVADALIILRKVVKL